MKFRCQNCAIKFSINIITDEQRDCVFCPECGTYKVRFAGAGYIKDNNWEINKEDNEDDTFLSIKQKIGDIK